MDWWVYLIVGILIFAAGVLAGMFGFMLKASDSWLSGYITIDPTNEQPGKDIFITFTKEKIDLRKQKFIMLTVKKGRKNNEARKDEM